MLSYLFPFLHVLMCLRQPHLTLCTHAGFRQPHVINIVYARWLCLTAAPIATNFTVYARLAVPTHQVRTPGCALSPSTHAWLCPLTKYARLAVPSHQVHMPGCALSPSTHACFFLSPCTHACFFLTPVPGQLLPCTVLLSRRTRTSLWFQSLSHKRACMHAHSICTWKGWQGNLQLSRRVCVYLHHSLANPTYVRFYAWA